MLPDRACLQRCMARPLCPACVSPWQHKSQAQLSNGHAIHHERALAPSLQVGLVGSMQLLQSGANASVKPPDVVQVQGLPQRRPARRKSPFCESRWKCYTVSPTLAHTGPLWQLEQLPAGTQRWSRGATTILRPGTALLASYLRQLTSSMLWKPARSAKQQSRTMTGSLRQLIITATGPRRTASNVGGCSHGKDALYCIKTTAGACSAQGQHL